MDNIIKKYLFDIREAINEIESFVAQRPKKYEVFVNDTMFRRAIERNIGIIGEAVAKILQLNPSIKIKEAKSIRSTRNYIVHAYDTLRLDMIWDIVVNDLPNLKIEISELLDCPH